MVSSLANFFTCWHVSTTLTIALSNYLRVNSDQHMFGCICYVQEDLTVTLAVCQLLWIHHSDLLYGVSTLQVYTM